MTNWWPMMRIAWRTARRMAGSPARPTKRRKAPMALRRVSSARLTMRPVSIRPQVEAFTSTELDWPMWRSQSASPSLSRISLSAVARSGMRSRASATHISSTPSSLDRSYWRMKASTMPGSAARMRVRPTRATAVAWTLACSSAGRRAWSSSSARCSASSRWKAAVTRARSSDGAPGSSGLRIGFTGVHEGRRGARENADSKPRAGGAKAVALHVSRIPRGGIGLPPPRGGR